MRVPNWLYHWLDDRGRIPKWVWWIWPRMHFCREVDYALLENDDGCDCWR